MARPSAARKVQERSVATRAALLDAALESLVEVGYSATTTMGTARRAGVSRGAQLHHFRTRTELLTAAVERLFERRVREFREAFERFDPGADPVDAAIDLLWSMFQGPAFVAWVELWVAARTDSELARAVIAMDRRFDAKTSAVFAAMFPSVEADDVFQEIGRDFAFALMDGVALIALHKHGQRPPEDHLRALKSIAHLTRDQVTT
jgi:AcrR family transcriptional regulator